MNINNISIRKIYLDDIEALQSIGIKTFSETFNETNSQEDMQNYFSDKFSVEHLSKELNNAESEFYFAELDGKAIGYLKVNLGSAQTEQLLEQALEIERIYVLKEFHGQKIGQYLFDKALDITRSLNLKRLWLGVWDENTKAIQFYQRQGFEKFAEHRFVLGDKVDNDWLMKLELTELE